MRELAKKIQELTTLMSTEDLPSATQKHHITTMAMAMAIAYDLPLPTGSVHSPKSWYMINGFPVATDIVGRLNDSFIPVDVANVMTIIRNIWTLRYNILHVPNSHAAISATYKAVEDASDELAEVYRQFLSSKRSAHFYSTIVNLMTRTVSSESRGIS